MSLHIDCSCLRELSIDLLIVPHSYYYTTCILVLKFTNKRVFFEEIKDSHFRKKGGILVLTSQNLEKKGLILSPMFYHEKRVHWGIFWYSPPRIWRKRLNFEPNVLPWKKGSLGLKSQCFIMKKVSFWAEKWVFCHKEGHHFQTVEQGWVPLFPVSEGAGSLMSIPERFSTKWTKTTKILLLCGINKVMWKVIYFIAVITDWTILYLNIVEPLVAWNNILNNSTLKGLYFSVSYCFKRQSEHARPNICRVIITYSFVFVIVCIYLFAGRGAWNEYDDSSLPL